MPSTIMLYCTLSFLWKAFLSCVLVFRPFPEAAVETTNIKHPYHEKRNLESKSSSLWTPKFAASDDDRVLNVHIVAHTHDDVGWLKTVEQYYYGLNNTIQNAAVKYILSSSVNALEANPNRTFVYVEQKFFSMWWNEQADHEKQTVKKLVANKQLGFVNGGWCMHDEAATHFMGMIDQTTLGHQFLKRELGIVPTVGWQLDPFGHSATQASFMSAEMGFNALYFGRIDHADLKRRKDTQECEGLWSSSPNLEDATVFWGLTGSFLGNYNPPPNFCFDVQCNDEPLVGQSKKRLMERVTEFVNDIKTQSDQSQGNHIMMTMGTDFQYSNALVNFANLDLLIHSMLTFQETGDVDMPALLGPNFDRLAVFYSSPDYYTEQKYKETRKRSSSLSSSNIRALSPPPEDSTGIEWSTKKDDFFPYSDCEHCYWTGYFTSRTAFKRLERVGSSFLQAARQIESMSDYNTCIKDCHCGHPLYSLEDAMGISQHHDSVSGTAKQHVANDYSKRLQAGLNEASAYVAKKLRKMLLQDDPKAHLQDLSFCQLLNETTCDVSEHAVATESDLYVVVYNGLAQSRSSVVGIPLAFGQYYLVHRLTGHGKRLKEQPVRYWQKNIPSSSSKTILYIETGPLPAVGGAVFKISLGDSDPPSVTKLKDDRRASDVSCHHNNGEYSNGILDIKFDCDTGMIERVSNALDGSNVSLAQEFGYYTSFDSSIDNSADGLNPTQNSGAYIFRPSSPTQQLTKVFPKSGSAVIQKTNVGFESRVIFQEPWIEQVTRVYNGMPFIEIEYTVGPIPIDDGVGKEIVVRYSTPIRSQSTFYTDSNGREFQRRTRSFRPTWELKDYEPIAGNYYPVNAAMYIEDETASLSVVVDRSQAGASLFDGSLELMIQRRILADDSRGVSEPLNETTGGVTPYPPYGDASRFGDGIVVKGKHRLLIGGGMSGASLARSQMDGAYTDPVVFVGTAPHGSMVPFQQTSFSGIQASLPANVMLITWQLLQDEPPKTYLVRLGHQYGAGEDDELSGPVSVDLGSLFSRYNAVSLVEKTLSGNQDRSKWEEKRFRWTDQKEQSERHTRSTNQGDFVVELRPMEIRTFHLQVEATC